MKYFGLIIWHSGVLLRIQCTKIESLFCNAYISLKSNRNCSNLYIVGISNEQGIHKNDDSRYVINRRGVTRQKPQFLDYILLRKNSVFYIRTRKFKFLSTIF